MIIELIKLISEDQNALTRMGFKEYQIYQIDIDMVCRRRASWQDEITQQIQCTVVKG